MLVEAVDEAQARQFGQAALLELYANDCARLDKDVPINILTVRHATDDEIEFWRWTRETLTREGAAMNR